MRKDEQAQQKLQGPGQGATLAVPRPRIRSVSCIWPGNSAAHLVSACAPLENKEDLPDKMDDMTVKSRPMLQKVHGHQKRRV